MRFTATEDKSCFAGAPFRTPLTPSTATEDKPSFTVPQNVAGSSTLRNRAHARPRTILAIFEVYNALGCGAWLLYRNSSSGARRVRAT